MSLFSPPLDLSCLSSLSLSLWVYLCRYFSLFSLPPPSSPSLSPHISVPLGVSPVPGAEVRLLAGKGLGSSLPLLPSPHSPVLVLLRPVEDARLRLPRPAQPRRKLGGLCHGPGTCCGPHAGDHLLAVQRDRRFVRPCGGTQAEGRMG